MKLPVKALMLQLVVFGLLLFGPAGRLDWWRAWVFLGLDLVFCLALFRGIDPGLLRERLRGPFSADQPRSDKLLGVGFSLIHCLWMMFLPMDVFHWKLLPSPSLAASSFGLALILGAFGLCYLTLRQNVFASPIVRLQSERGQKLVDTGLYAFVRHPLYAAGMLLFAGLALWLESTAGFWLSAVPMALLVVRIRIEERFLLQHLEGYADYCRRVRYRVLPGLY